MLVCLAVLLPYGFVSATGVTEGIDDASYSVGVFVPGVVDGSPTYEMMVSGAERAVSERAGTSVTVVEGGFDQSTWEESLMSMAASARYDLIVTSNPSMPEIAARVASTFSGQRFLVLDGYLVGNGQIHTVLFNQREQAFLAGYFAGLVTTGALPDANDQLAVGLLAGQEYPIMNDVMVPGYELGARTVHPGITVDFRVLGNWYDAGKAAEIVADMVSTGVDIVLAIAGGGNQGAIAAARELGAYVIWYDSSGYDNAPGIVAGSTLVRQDEATYEAVLAAIDGTLVFGEARILGIAEGAVAFDNDHPAYRRLVPAAIRSEMEAVLDRIRSGDVTLDMPVP